MNFETSVKKYLVDLTVNSQEQEPMIIYGSFAQSETGIDFWAIDVDFIIQ